MTEELVKAVTHDGFAHIQLNRPAKRNALNLEMLSELVRLLDGYASNAAVRPLSSQATTGASRRARTSARSVRRRQSNSLTVASANIGIGSPLIPSLSSRQSQATRWVEVSNLPSPATSS